MTVTLVAPRSSASQGGASLSCLPWPQGAGRGRGRRGSSASAGLDRGPLATTGGPLCSCGDAHLSRVREADGAVRAPARRVISPIWRGLSLL